MDLEHSGYILFHTNHVAPLSNDKARRLHVEWLSQTIVHGVINVQLQLQSQTIFSMGSSQSIVQWGSSQTTVHGPISDNYCPWSNLKLLRFCLLSMGGGYLKLMHLVFVIIQYY